MKTSERFFQPYENLGSGDKLLGSVEGVENFTLGHLSVRQVKCGASTFRLRTAANDRARHGIVATMLDMAAIYTAI